MPSSQNEHRVIRTTRDLLRLLDLKALPTDKAGILGAIDTLAEHNITLEGQALSELSMTLTDAAAGTVNGFVGIAKELEGLFRRADAAHDERLRQLVKILAVHDLPPAEQRDVLNALLEGWSKEKIVEKKIWGDLARIAGTALGAMAIIVVAKNSYKDAAIAYKEARPKNIWDVLDGLRKK